MPQPPRKAFPPRIRGIPHRALCFSIEGGLSTPQGRAKEAYTYQFIEFTGSSITISSCHEQKLFLCFKASLEAQSFDFRARSEKAKGATRQCIIYQRSLHSRRFSLERTGAEWNKFQFRSLKAKTLELLLLKDDSREEENFMNYLSSSSSLFFLGRLSSSLRRRKEDDESRKNILE